ncbi:MAG: polyprenyl synthetase family protein [Verrucomicrobiales bacterium]|nr:polyprenyl synthetase family protein [Verrucomicrobiales bacterium]
MNNRNIEDPKIDLKTYAATQRKLIDQALNGFLPRGSVRPKTLHKSMRYSLFAGGKRLRPILCLAAAEACGGTIDQAMPSACAVECIHTYSLIHDDLPCMDDDDLRRGKPTNHKVFGESVAVLAGDALLTLAFEIVGGSNPNRRYDIGDMVKELAVTSGSKHLVGGQVLDIEGENAKIGPKALRFIHESKTAALLTCSLKLGAMSAAATPKKLEALTNFGRSTGLAFQIIDDILDVTQTSEKLGKSAGKDEAVNKSTYPAIYGLSKSRNEAAKLTEAAINSLNIFGKAGARLKELAHYLLDRDY